MEERGAQEADDGMRAGGGMENACINVCREEGRSGYASVEKATPLVGRQVEK